MKSFKDFVAEDGAAPATVTSGIAGVKSGDLPPVKKSLQTKYQKQGAESTKQLAKSLRKITGGVYV
jgi:hypothetical protein